MRQRTRILFFLLTGIEEHVNVLVDSAVILDGNNMCGYAPRFVLCYIKCEIWSEWRVELSWIICVIACCVFVCVCDVPQNP